MDALTDVLHALELKGWLHSRMEMILPWRFDFLTSPDSIFHLLSGGHGYLSVEGEAAPRRIGSGDVLLFPFGHAHSIGDEPSSPLTRTVHLAYSAHREYQVLPFEGEGPKMGILCGAFHFEHPNDYPFLQCLPKVIHIPGEQGRMAQSFAELVQMLARESGERLVGREVVLRRLTELLFIQVIRVWIEQQAETSTGWIAALRDQSISTALGLIHQSPDRGWKVEELAEAVALSRSAFSARFTRLVGEAPITYLTRWRMQRAKRLLKNDVKIQTIAPLVGYESEVAFRQAFKREVGISPARYRKLGEPVSTTWERA
ncbi:AraC family transcriptional regulator [Reticulibacter mediterranei]|uniref:AraC family transcriptional regulator n=1 Tax=Reticulibacter mediterranei TaxID=2778369 RepID=A0A8J3IB69_9CHLR|nr:AraC family transcriptional regulator [Reticulibacter mediterranei]GHO90408.1 AraC family transcriptional regulator [Reticulibacter mediterranei]